ncbi:MAG: UDP-3-O-(3-hydroxymyristoyl)glucosamine N-acyltransferase [Limnobacter sp.]|nr:UDP-3-O-(3-hydroxymyristoyl)glucosamine N-acyltransferase [Limnobacter sp.]
MIFQPTPLEVLLAEFGGELQTYAPNTLDHSAQPSKSSGGHSKGGQTPPSSDVFEGIHTLEKAGPRQIAFLTNPKYRDQLLTTSAGLVMVRQKDFDSILEFVQGAKRAEELRFWCLADPYLLYAKIQQWWVQRSAFKPSPGTHPSAVVGEGVKIAPSAYIGPHVVLGDYTTIGENCRIEAGVVLGRHVTVGYSTLLHANVTVYDECEIGARCILHSGVVIGADGFGFANEKGTWVKIPQVGRVIVADDVEIGANTTVDRGALDDTLIGVGVKLDNQIMVAHNVQIGDHTAMAGCVGVAGSTRIGARCTIGGAANIFGHLTIPDGTHVSGCTTVIASIKEAGAYTGIFPMDTHKSWEKTAATLRQLVALRSRVRELEKALQNKENEDQNK